MANIEQDGYLSKASLSNFRVSPRKARLVIDLVRGKSVADAIDILATCDKKTAPVVEKLLLSAVANAKHSNSDIDVDDLKVSAAWVNEASSFKRSMPRARGSASPIIKRRSHITVVLDES
ncbi:MAG TPA: 50S ribosomal protein L22 [Oligoflexia bacterium]|nr:50S ribosomal protein L22 [Oligoflexia bacterium]HMP49200.1 50S ribosomal protein L22 [Oligoflexia bacterium]